MKETLKMEINNFTDQNFLKVVSIINKIKPDFGIINLELTFHEKKLSRIKILTTINTIVYEKNAKKEENHE